MIGTQPKGKGGTLDDQSKAIWESAHRNGSILFIHPVFDSGDERVNDFGMNNAVGRITDTLIAISESFIQVTLKLITMQKSLLVSEGQHCHL